jgi:hypothetical protein
MNVIKLNLESLIRDNVRPDEYVFMKLISLNESDTLSSINLSIDLQEMESNGYIKTNGMNDLDLIELTDLAKKILSISDEDVVELSSLIREMFNNTKPGFVDPLTNVVYKMRVFKTTFNQYDNDVIKVACQMYIHYCSRDLYKYMIGRLSKFILDVSPTGEPVSLLANWCETVISMEQNEEENSITKA